LCGKYSWTLERHLQKTNVLKLGPIFDQNRPKTWQNQGSGPTGEQSESVN